MSWSEHSASQKRYWMTILGGPVSCSGSYFGFQWQSSAIWTNLDRPFMSWSEHSATYGTTYNRKGGSVTFPKRWESYQTNLARHIGFNHHINDREQLVLGEYDWVHRNQSLSEAGPSNRTYVVENPRLYGGNKPFFDFINLKKDTDYNREMSKETTFTINSFSGFMGNEGGGTHHDRILGLHAAPPRIIVEDDSNNMYTWLKFKSYDGPFDMSDDPTEQPLTSKGDGNPAHLTVPMSDFRNQQCTSAAGCGATLEQSFFKLTMEYTTNQHSMSPIATVISMSLKIKRLTSGLQKHVSIPEVVLLLTTCGIHVSRISNKRSLWEPVTKSVAPLTQKSDGQEVVPGIIQQRQ